MILFFKNTEKQTENRTVELISYENKKLKFSNKNKLFQTNTKYVFFIFILKKVSSYGTHLLRELLGYYTIRYDSIRFDSIRVYLKFERITVEFKVKK